MIFISADNKRAGAPPALDLRNASLSFSGVKALDDVSLSVARGEIRALIGKNGSGKSTLIKILSGFHTPAPGTTLSLDGQSVDLPAAPERLRALGLAFVHQDLGLIPDASIFDNMLVGRFSSRGLAPIAWSREKARVERALARFGVAHAPHRPVRELRAVDRALVAIARGFLDAGGRGGVIVLDEPTAFLPQAEVGRLFAAIRALAADGAAVIYVSHRLDEVLALSHVVTVLRDGKIVHEGPTRNLGENELVDHILGEDISRFYPELAPARAEIAIEIEALSGTIVKNLSLQVRRGEIIGVTGLGGSGYEELPYLLSGAAPATSGSLSIGDRKIPAKALNPPAVRDLGLALLPADRQRASAAQRLTVRENVSLPVLENFFHWGRLQGGAERGAVRDILIRFGVHPQNPEAQLRTLSGGNQQKALLGKWMQTAPAVLVLHEPTQGVDVGSKQDIFRKIEEAAADGVAVIIASAEVEDLAHLCHRVAVLRRGSLAGVLAGAQRNEQAIHDLAFRDRAPDRLPEKVLS